MRVRRIAGLVAAVLLVGRAAGAQQGAGRIEGVVRDSLRDVPLADAIVIATPPPTTRDTVFHSARADARGHFVIQPLAAGRYTLSVEHPVIDSTGIGVPATSVDVSASRTASITLGTPSPRTLRALLCPQALTDTTLGVMLGVIRTTDGAPAANASVVFSWSDFDVDTKSVSVKPKLMSAATNADANGVYRGCGLPVQRQLFVQAQTSSQQSGIVEEVIGSVGVLLRDFRVSAVAIAAAASADSAQATSANVRVVPRSSASASSSATSAAAELPGFVVQGTVQGTRGEPIAAARVTVTGTGRSSDADASGAFRLTGVPGGTQGVEVIALGYYPRTLRLDVGAGMSPLVIRVEKSAVVLDSMRVIARKNSVTNNPFYREFEQRLANGQGRYLTEDEIASKHMYNTTDLFRFVPGVRVTPQRGSFDPVVVSTRGLATFGGGSGACLMEVFIDGIRVENTDINLIPPSELHGIEVYSTVTAPIKYHVGKCGAIFLWTK